MLTLLSMIWRGLAIGVIISAPMGPVGILCIQRTLNKGRKTGFYTGVGAALSDLLYCLLTGFGLSFIEEFLNKNQNIIQIIGSIVLILFGVYLFKKNPSKSLRKPDSIPTSTVKKDILGGFLFTFSNPLIIFLIIGLFARFNFLLPEIKFYHYIMGYLAIVAGALGWWWVVTYFVNKLRSHFNLRSMWIINKAIGAIILVFALVGIITSIISLSTPANAQISPPPPTRITTLQWQSDAYSNPGDATLLFYDTITKGASGDFLLTWAATDLHASQNRKYPVASVDGTSTLVASPGYGFALLSPADSAAIELHLVPTRIKGKFIDELITNDCVSLRISVKSAQSIATSTFSLPYSPSINLIIERAGNRLRILNHKGKPISQLTLHPFPLERIATILPPGASCKVNTKTLRYKPSDFSILKSKWVGHTDSLLSHLQRSTSPIEGIYNYIDRDMDENLLAIGGNYRVAIVASSPTIYHIIYLGGAEKYASLWKEGMIKGFLTPTSQESVFDLRWYDAEGLPLFKDLKATIASGYLILNFPYQRSSMRFIKNR